MLLAVACCYLTRQNNHNLIYRINAFYYEINELQIQQKF